MCFLLSTFFYRKHIDDEDQCADNEFMCDYDKCILKSQKCDGTVDCIDETDELNCHQNQGLCVAIL